jgi:hypothetical protein
MLLAAPHLHLAEICRGLCDDIDRAVNGTDEQKDLSVAIRQADSDLKKTVISSIVKFGLADLDEREEGRLTKSANDLLMQRSLPHPLTPQSRTHATTFGTPTNAPSKVHDTLCSPRRLG